MNKMQLPFALALLIFSGSGAMEEIKDCLQNTPCKLIDYKFKGPNSVVCRLFHEDVIATLVTEKEAQEEDAHLDVMVQQITKPETLELFADVLKLYRENRFPYRPWCGAGSAKRNIELAIPGLKDEITEGTDLCENLQYYNDEHHQIAMIDEQKKLLRKLMAAQVALHLLTCAELDQKMALAKEKLKQESAHGDSTKN